MSRSPIGAVLLMVTCAGVFLLSGCRSPIDNFPDHTERLRDSLRSYEQFVQTLRKQDGGYPEDPGYPMYLYSFGSLYLFFWEIDGDAYYRSEFERIAGAILNGRETDWTWRSWAGYKSPLYNWLFSELFLNAGALFDDPALLDTAGSIVGGLRSPDVFNQNADNYGRSANGNFLPYLAIERYLSVTGTTDVELESLAHAAYAYAASLYDESNGRWYYGSAEKNAAVYDAHAAYYQMLLIQVFLDYVDDFYTSDDPRVRFIEDQIPFMTEVVVGYLTPDATFRYNDEIDDYTESAVTVLLTLELVDQRYRLDHNDLKSAAKTTILTRQAEDGNYYGTGDTSITEVWWGDEIAAYLPKYLRRIE